MENRFSNMTDEQLRLAIEAIKLIAIEATERLTAIEEVIKERKNKKS